MKIEGLPREGTYRVAIASSHEDISKVTERPFWRVSMVILGGEFEGAVLHTAFSDAQKASHPWIDVVEHPRDLPGEICLAHVRHDVGPGSRTFACVKRLSPIDVPESIERFGRMYRLMPGATA